MRSLRLIAAAVVVALVAAGGVYAIVVGLVEQAGVMGARLEGGLENFRRHAEPKDAPALAFTDAAGTAMTLEAFEGRWTLLNSWATWCAPCLEEMPSLDRLQAALGSDRFRVVALSVDRTDRAEVQGWLDRLGVKNLPLYIDQSGQAAFAFRSPGLPTTVLLDPQGREVARLVGPAEWDSEQAQRILRSIVEQPAGGGATAR